MTTEEETRLNEARGYGETMHCGHNSKWLVYTNPADVDSERHCLFCEVERLQNAIQFVRDTAFCEDDGRRIDDDDWLQFEAIVAGRTRGS